MFFEFAPAVAPEKKMAVNHLLRPTVAVSDDLRHVFFLTFGFDGQWTRRVLLVECVEIVFWHAVDA